MRCGRRGGAEKRAFSRHGEQGTGRVKLEVAWWASKRGRHLCKICFEGLDLLDIPPARARPTPSPPLGTTGCPRRLPTALKTS